MNILIGIISYLPKDLDIRKQRFNKLQNLIKKCNQLFNLPIYIVIQNYLNDDCDSINKLKNVYLSDNYDKLGILTARRKLREYFITSEFDYLIMLDDDCELVGDSGKVYLDTIKNNPNCFIEFNKTLLKLFAISKTIFKQVDYADVEPEKEEGFEDRIFVNILRNKFSKCRRTFKNTGIYEFSISTKDKLSTWYKNQDLKKMIDLTKNLLNEQSEIC